MPSPERHDTETDAVETLLRNAELRDQLEPLYDESIGSVDVCRMTTPRENAFLESMLEWERAPMLPVAEWFDPPLTLPETEGLTGPEISRLLLETVRALYSKQIVLDFTDHLSDRDLYTLVARDILPAYEKKLDRRDGYLHWDCAGASSDPETWLRYYATEQERQMWANETGETPPAPAKTPYRRRLPKAPL